MKYEIRRNKRARRMIIRVMESGEVVVTAPARALNFQIKQFVLENQAWINRQKEKVQLRQKVDPNLDWEQNLIKYKGKLYRFEFSEAQKEKVVISGGIIKVSPVTKLKHDVKQTLLKWLKLEASIYINRATEMWAKKMRVKYNRISMKQQRSRWGSCSRRGNLNFNWRLVHFDEDVIDYVIIHELAHLKEMNHSKAFWDIVREFDPDFKRKLGYLKKQTILIE